MCQDPSPLPVREPTNRIMATAGRWNMRNRNLMERVIDGLKALDRPAICRSQAPIRGYAHAYQVMAVHAEHHCPRYGMAARYAEDARS